MCEYNANDSSFYGNKFNLNYEYFVTCNLNVKRKKKRKTILIELFH